jgi:AcrR family transcriptional regulator
MPRQTRKSTPPRRRTGPGRPEGVSLTREHILNAAEEVFAELGYAGTSLREIVDRAHVTKALANYYFGNKEKLFEEIFLRRALPIVEERMVALAALKRTKGDAITVRDLVDIYLAPLLRMPRVAPAKNFMQIHARLHMEPQEFALSLRREVYNESTRAYAEAIHAVLPHLSLKTVYWRLILMVGANLYAISGTHRIEEISKGLCNPGDFDDVVEHVTDFVAAGLQAPVSAGEANKPVPPVRSRRSARTRTSR